MWNESDIIYFIMETSSGRNGIHLYELTFYFYDPPPYIYDSRGKNDNFLGFGRAKLQHVLLGEVGMI